MQDAQELILIFKSGKTSPQTLMEDVVKLMRLAEKFVDWSGERKKQAVVSCIKQLVDPLLAGTPWLAEIIDIIISPAINFIVEDFQQVRRLCQSKCSLM